MRKEGQPFVVTVPMHNRDIPYGTLRGILNDAEMSIEDFISFLDQ
jgi:predicted RNA binding protein YcfA (HicA-like mRNA interferase family)